MTVSIFTILAALPSGIYGAPLSPDELSEYLGDHYFTDDETQREERHRLRDSLYRDGGFAEMDKLINTTYSEAENREKYKRWSKYARFNNVTKRIVNELSNVYQEPATRSVAGSVNNAKYQIILALAKFNDFARRMNRMLNLHRAIIVSPRVTKMPDGDVKLSIDIVTPANARLITHPNDQSCIVAIAVRIRPKTQKIDDDDRKPAWIIWSDHERFFVDSKFRFILGTHLNHGLGVNPCVFISLEPPDDVSPWPGTSGEDLIAADMSIWFAAVSLLKETKSSTRQTILSGDLSGMTRGQVQDSEVPIHAPDGVAVNSVDMSMDLSLFRDTADHILEHVANNYGMSAALITHQGVQSAEARDLMRVPLHELRREQQIVLRIAEREIAESLSAVVGADIPGLAFMTEGWMIDFAESHTPLSPKEELERFEHERRLLLANSVDYLVNKNPDITREVAEEKIKRNAKINEWQTRLQRDTMFLNGSLQGNGQVLGDAGLNGRSTDDDDPIQSTGDADITGEI